MLAVGGKVHRHKARCLRPAGALIGYCSPSLVAQWLVPRSSAPGSSPGQGRCNVFLSKTLNSQSASLHPGV